MIISSIIDFISFKDNMCIIRGRYLHIFMPRRRAYATRYTRSSYGVYRIGIYYITPTRVVKAVKHF